jgi:hypothetical protein
MAKDRAEKSALALAVNSDFYRTLTGAVTKEERDRAKVEFNSGVNDRNGRAWRYPAWTAFIARFPKTAAMVMALKSKDHRNAACVLQRMESRLVFNEVVADLENQGIPAISLHDAIYTTPEHREAVRSAMVKAAIRSLGVHIQAKGATSNPDEHNQDHISPPSPRGNEVQIRRGCPPRARVDQAPSAFPRDYQAIRLRHSGIQGCVAQSGSGVEVVLGCNLLP